MRRGEIYWVDFEPRKESEQGGIRPALVIQNDVGNRFSPTTIVTVMTRTFPNPLYPFLVLVEPEESGLSERGVANCAQLRTISADPSTRRIVPPRGETEVWPIGRLGPEKMAEIDLALHRSLGLRYPIPDADEDQRLPRRRQAHRGGLGVGFPQTPPKLPDERGIAWCTPTVAEEPGPVSARCRVLSYGERYSSIHISWGKRPANARRSRPSA